jgi:Domain of unknown function (DUF222)
MASAEVLAEIAAVRDTVAGWFDADRSGWTAADHSVVLRALLDLQERTHAMVVHATAEWDRYEAWSADGALTPTAWLRSRGSLAEPDAGRTVRSARLVERSDDLAKLLAHGDVAAGHVEALASRVTPPRALLFDEHADVLLNAVRTLSVDDTAAMARRWAAYADDELNRGEPADLHGRRGVWFRQVGDRTEGRVLGTPEELAVLRTALDRLEPPDRTDAPGGARSLAQRRYDALVALASLGLQNNKGRVDPDHTINVVIDAATLAGDFDPNGRSDIPGWSSSLPSRVQQLLCNSWISRVILGPTGEVLELGRRARFFSPGQQRALLVQFGGCAFECCDRPPEWCEIHHLDPYGPPTRGETNLANGLPTCRPHHTLIHRGWKPVQDADGTWHLEPP